LIEWKQQEVIRPEHTKQSVAPDCTQLHLLHSLYHITQLLFGSTDPFLKLVGWTENMTFIQEASYIRVREGTQRQHQEQRIPQNTEK